MSKSMVNEAMVVYTVTEGRHVKPSMLVSHCAATYVSLSSALGTIHAGHGSFFLRDFNLPGCRD